MAVDIYRDAIMSVSDAAQALTMPRSTLSTWKRAGSVHGVSSTTRGAPALPFIGVVEAFVLDAIRQAGFRTKKIHEAVAGIREFYGDEYALARPGLGHDGSEIFIKTDRDYLRARDLQQAIQETILGFEQFIDWDDEATPRRLRLRQFDNVILDPRFGWGQPVLADSKVPVSAIVGLWYAGEPITAIGAEFDLPPNQVEEILRVHARSAKRAA